MISVNMPLSVSGPTGGPFDDAGVVPW
jgi:hypothetical protein